MRVLIADDHSLFRDGIVSLLLEAGGHTIVGQASNGIEAIEQTRLMHPDLVLMDIHMPIMSGLDALKRIKKELPTVLVVMLTVSEEDSDLFEAIRSGANGYILKQINANEFFQLLENLRRGDAAIPPAIATRLFKSISRLDEKPEKHTLSDRELDVLKLVANGNSNRDIALMLSVSDNTVKFHLKNIMHKLNVSNRLEAVKIATQNHLI